MFSWVVTVFFADLGALLTVMVKRSSAFFWMDSEVEDRTTDTSAVPTSSASGVPQKVCVSASKLSHDGSSLPSPSPRAW